MLLFSWLLLVLSAWISQLLALTGWPMSSYLIWCVPRDHGVAAAMASGGSLTLGLKCSKVRGLCLLWIVLLLKAPFFQNWVRGWNFKGTHLFKQRFRLQSVPPWRRLVASDLFRTVVAFSPPSCTQPTPLPQLHPPNPPTQSNKPRIIFAFFSSLLKMCLVSFPFHCWIIHSSDLQKLKEKEKCVENVVGRYFKSQNPFSHS